MPSKRILFADETENDVFDLLTPKDTFRARKEDRLLSDRLQRELLIKGQFRCFEASQLMPLSTMTPQELQTHIGGTLQESVKILRLLSYHQLYRGRPSRGRF